MLSKLYVPWGEPAPSCPKAALLYLGCSSLVSASPLFLDKQLFEPALWNSVKVMQDEAYSLQARNRGHKKASMPRSPAGSCSVTLVPDLNCRLSVGVRISSNTAPRVKGNLGRDVPFFSTFWGLALLLALGFHVSCWYFSNRFQVSFKLFGAGSYINNLLQGVKIEIWKNGAWCIKRSLSNSS